MSSEEPPEERKLSVVKSWFSRSISSGALHGPSEAASDAVPDLFVSKEGGLEDRETFGGFTTLRQLSMRRSRPSGEIERETGVGSPSMTPRNVTPLTPLTPLKWKSNLREQEEEEKAIERSRLGILVAGAMPTGELSAATVVMNSGQEGQESELQQQQEEPVLVTIAHGRTKSIDEISLKAHLGAEENSGVESLGGHERKPSSGDDVMTMTIEFLRARLLSERSASKAAKQRVQELGKKVMELESKLKQAVEEKKNAEEALLRLETAGRSEGPQLISRSGPGGEETKEELQQDESSTGDLSRTVSNGSSDESRDVRTKQQLPTTASKIEERNADRGHADVWATPEKMFVTSQQESRAAIENRLRNMWNQISEEMTALAEERSQEDLVREELMSWMRQVPTVLQDIIPKKPMTSEDVKRGLSPEDVQDKDQVEADAKRAAVMLEEYEAQESVQREWERNYYESQRKLEQFKESLKADNQNADRITSGYTAGQGEYQHTNFRHGPHDSPTDASFLGFPHPMLPKSKSSSDFIPRRPHAYTGDDNTAQFNALYADSDSWGGERVSRPGAVDRHHDSKFDNNALAQQQRPIDPAYMSHSQMQERLAAPTRLQEAGHHGWSERQLQLEQDPYYQEAGNRGSRQYPSYPERGPFDRSHGPSTNRSSEDAYQSAQPHYRDGRPSWDDRGDREGWDHQQKWAEERMHHAQASYGEANGRTDRDNHHREREQEDPYRNMEPEGMKRRRHRRSLSDNSNWPAVEDYFRSPEHGAAFERPRQAHPAYPARMSPELPRSGFGNPNYGSSEDFRHRPDTIHGAHGQMRHSYPAAKANHGSGQHFSPQQADRNGYSKPESQLSLGYGPAYDVPRDDASVQQAHKDGGPTKNVSDVLRALQIAKANIQNPGSERIAYTSSTKQRPSGVRAPPSMPSGYGMDPPTRHMLAPRQGGSSGHLSEQFRYTKNLEHGTRAPGTRSLNSSPKGAKYDPSDMGLSAGDAGHYPIPGANGHGSYVDELNVGKGIQFFFP